MQNSTSPQQDVESRPSRLRMYAFLIGYLVALFGALSTFSVPLYVSFPSLLAGSGLVTLTFITAPTLTGPIMTWRSWLVMILGWLVIFGILCLLGDARVRLWRPHPAGYLPAWLICFYAVRHIHFWLIHPESHNNHDTELVIKE